MLAVGRGSDVSIGWLLWGFGLARGRFFASLSAYGRVGYATICPYFFVYSVRRKTHLRAGSDCPGGHQRAAPVGR